MKNSNKKVIKRALFQSLLFAIAIWMIESTVDWLFFYDKSLMDLIFLNLPAHEIYIRILFVISIFIFGLINAANQIRISTINRKLKNTNNELDTINQQLTANEQQLRATNEQLSANEQQLRASNQQLRASENSLAVKTHDLEERVKELNGLYHISKTIAKNNTIDDILQDVTKIIPPSWQYPEITCCRITYKEKAFVSEDFQETQWVLSASIIYEEEKVGEIEVFYKEKKPDLFDGPFLKEERKLIDIIAKNISRAVEKIQYRNQIEFERNQLQLHHKQFKAIFNGINDIMYVSDPETYEVVHANDIAKNTYGNDIIGKKCYEVIQGKKEPCSFCTNHDIMGENFGKTFTWEFKNETNNRWYKCTDKGIEWPDGRKLRFELATDITELIHLNEELLASNQQLTANEQQLRASNQQLIANEMQLKANNQELISKEKAQEDLKLRFQLANQSAGIGVWDLNLINNILVWDDWMYNLYGVSPDEFEGAYEAWQKGVHPDDLERASKEVELAINGIKEFDTEFRIVTPDGKIKYLKANAAVIKDDNGKAIKMIGVNYDISQIKAAESELKTNEKRYKQAEEIANVGSWEYNIRTTNFWGSDEAKNIYGFDKDVDEFTTDEVENCIPDRGKVHQALIDLIEKNKPYDLEFEIITKNTGELKIIRSIAVLEKNDNGLPNKVIGAVMDITNQKKTEAQLIDAKNIAQENETRFKALHDASFGGISIHDNGIIIDCNQGLSNISGYKIDELIGMEVLLLIADESKEIVTSMINAKYEKPYDAIGIRKNREKYPLRIEARMIPYKGKEVRVVEFRDITEQKKAENRIIESEQEIRSLLNNLDAGVVVHDRDTKIIDFNPRALELLGLNEGEFKGKSAVDPYWQFIDENSNPLAVELYPVKKIIEKKKALERMLMGVIRPKTKDTVWLLVNGYPTFNLQGELTGAVISFFDITNLKKAEKQLIEARKKAEESDELKSAFLANMSHEIRTPMNGILGFTSLLEEPDLTGEEQAQYIEIIKRSGMRMLSTVNDIIDISKIDSGQMELFISELDICLEIDSIYQFFKLEAENKGLEIKYIKDNIKENFIINTDKNKFNSILTNLIKNAIKFTDSGKIEIIASIANNKLICKVVDTGIGIPKNRIDAIFNRFEQADINDTRAKEGSGLGLTISKSYADMLSGQLEVESVFGKGSTFTLTLPFNT